MSECIFCKIAKGEIPCYKVHENKNFIAFLDINPIKKGHVLIIPKQHYRWVWDVPNIDEYFQTVKEVANKMRKALNPRLISSVVLGDEIPHAHVHLIPTSDEDYGFTLKRGNKVEEEEMKSISERIRQA